MKSNLNTKHSLRGDIEHRRFDVMVRHQFADKSKKRNKTPLRRYTEVTRTELVVEMNWNAVACVIVTFVSIIFIYYII